MRFKNMIPLVAMTLVAGCSSSSISSIWSDEPEAPENPYRTCVISTEAASALNNESLKLVTQALLDSSSTEVQIEALRTIKANSTSNYQRAHSVQLYRDASFALCQAYQSGMFSDPKEFSSSVSNLLAILTHNATLTQLEDDGETLTGESLEQYKQLQNEIQRTKRQLNTMIDDSSTHSAYLMAQMSITTMAFQSLNQEFSHYYDARKNETIGTLQAYKDATSGLNTDVMRIQNQINKIMAEQANLQAGNAKPE